MQRNRFLSDILTSLFDRRSGLPEDQDARDINSLCQALLSQEGDVSGQKLAAAVLSRYQGLTDDEKLSFFMFLNDAFDIDTKTLRILVADYAQTPTPQIFRDLTEAAEPKRQELLRRLNQPPGATAALVAMRVDLLNCIKVRPELARTDVDFSHLLRSWFNRGFLVLKQIDWDTPARILDKIVAYEAVHQINDWDDLRRRLYPPDRRCFAFFHPSMPDEPLIFVEIALTDAIPGSIEALLSDTRQPITPQTAHAAVFYSISNCQSGLAGISFGNVLIKQVVAELSLTYPNLTQFVTLSPIPGLAAWLTTQIQNPDFGHVAVAVLDQTASDSDVRAITARYLAGAKRWDGSPLDPVARFHLGNGAEIENIHARADLSENGLRQSCGAMVNYRYDLSKVERNHEDFALKSNIALSKPVLALTTAPFTTLPKELTP